MKKRPYPLGNKISQLLNEIEDDFVDVPNVEWDEDEYETHVPLNGLPNGGSGYSTRYGAYSEDNDAPIIPPKAKRKFIEELPPKDEFEDTFDDDEDNWDLDFDDEINEQKKQKDDPGAQQPDQDVNSMIDPASTGGDQDESGGTDDASMPTDPSDNTGVDDVSMPTDTGMDGGDTTGMADPSMSGDNAGGMADPSGGMGGDPNAMGDPSGGMGMGMGGDAPKTSEEIGRIFELKKIYSRMLAIEQHLSFSPDEILIKLRKYVTDAIELFETLISNIDSFKEQIDEIIVIFYKFLENVYTIMKKYYKIKKREDTGKSKLFTLQPKEMSNKDKTDALSMLKLNQ